MSLPRTGALLLLFSSLGCLAQLEPSGCRSYEPAVVALHQATGPLPQPSDKATTRRDDFVSNPRKKLFLTAVLTSHQLRSRATLFQQPQAFAPTTGFGEGGPRGCWHNPLS